jgi:DNA-directed RNA polymerase specialized sigma24 family protein
MAGTGEMACGERRDIRAARRTALPGANITYKLKLIRIDRLNGRGTTPLRAYCALALRRQAARRLVRVDHGPFEAVCRSTHAWLMAGTRPMLAEDFFAQIYRMQKSVIRHLRRFYDDLTLAEAEEAFQDAAMRCWANQLYVQYDPHQATLWAWFAYNARSCASHILTSKARAILHEAVRPTSDEGKNGWGKFLGAAGLLHHPDPAEAVLAADWLGHGLKTLTEKDRQAVRAYHRDRLRGKALAAALGVSAKHGKAPVERATQKLCRALLALADIPPSAGQRGQDLPFSSRRSIPKHTPRTSLYED